MNYLNKVAFKKIQKEKGLSHLNIELLEPFKANRYPIKTKCHGCNKEYYTKIYTILQHNRVFCPDCNLKLRNQRCTLTHDIFLKRLKKNNIKVYPLENYIKLQTKIKFKCECGNIWKARPDRVLEGNKCKKCSNKDISLRNRRTNEHFIKQFKIKNTHNIHILEKYEKINKKIKVICNTCNHIWKVQPHSLLLNYGCPKCKPKKHSKLMSKNYNDFIKSILTKDKYFFNKIEIVDKKEFVNFNTKIHFKCKKCNHVWKTNPQFILNGTRCPKCKTSKGEQAIKEFLNKNSIKYNQEKCFTNCIYKKPLRFDFFLPEQNLCIEYHGEQHYRPIKYWGGVKAFLKQQKRDQIKETFCKDNSINLLVIPYKNNVYKILKDNILCT